MISSIIAFLSVASSQYISNAHNLKFPFDSNFNAKKWVYGGHTVLTQHFARLTPFSANTSGWILSAKSLPPNFEEVVTVLNVEKRSQTTTYYGGAIHFVTDIKAGDFFVPSMQPGHFFGISVPKSGVSVVTESFNERVQTVYLIDNTDGSLNEILDKKDTILQDHRAEKNSSYSSCNIDLRNAEGQVQYKIRTSGNRVIVYLTTLLKNARPVSKFCLSVKLAKPFTEEQKVFLAVSAHNTELTDDITEVREIVVRHQKSSKKMEQSEEEIERFLSKERGKYKVDRSHGKFKKKAKRVFWLFMTVSGMVLFLEALWELSLLKYMAADQTNPTATLTVINRVIPFSIFLHFAVFAALIVSFNLLTSVLLLPLTVWRFHKLLRGSYRLMKEDYDYTQKSNRYTMWLYVSGVVYAVFTYSVMEVLISF